MLDRHTMQVPRRIEKARRYLAWRFTARGLPLWWHVSRPNFGEAISRPKTPLFSREIRPPAFLGGSAHQHHGGSV
jgi:hypothetical protein